MKTNQCQICGEGELTYHTEKVRFEYNGVSEELDSHYALCNICGEQGGAEEMRKNKRVMIAFKKRALGYLSSAQVKQIREQLNLTQSEAATIFGGGEKAFSKYENDDVIQSGAMDKLLRVVSAHPDTLTELRNPSTDVSSDTSWYTVKDAVRDEPSHNSRPRATYHAINIDSGWQKAA